MSRPEPSAPVRILAALATVALVAAVAADLSPYLRGPAPWPPEWRWRPSAAAPEHGVFATAAWGLALVGLVAAAAGPWLERASRAARAALVALATVGAIGFAVSGTGLVAGDGAVDVMVERTLSDGFTSYHAIAVGDDARDVGWLLANYEELRPDFPIHGQAHPPGPVLFYRALHGWVAADAERARSLAARARAWGYAPHPRAPVPSDAALASALVASFAVVGATALGVIAMAILARCLGASRRSSVVLAGLLAVQPAFALVTPYFDKLLIPLQLAVTALLAVAMAPGARGLRRHGAAAAAGLAVGLCLFCSYGSAVFLVVGGLLATAASLARGARLVPDLLPTIAVASAVSVAAFFAPLLIGYDPLAGLLAGLDIHGEITAARSYPAWLVFNLWDVFVFGGPPLVVLTVARAAGAGRALVGGERAPRIAAGGLVAATLVVALLLLDLSGTALGETGRVWAPLLPYLVLAAGYEREGEPSAWTPRDAAALAALLAVTSFTLRWFWQTP